VDSQGALPNHVQCRGGCDRAATSAILMLNAHGFVWPHMIWSSAKKGCPVALDGVISPPQSLWDVLKQLRLGVCLGKSDLHLFYWVFNSQALIAESSAQLKVDVSSNEIYFLGSEPRDLPTHLLLGDTKSDSASYPPGTRTRLIYQADGIAQGMSRFSFLPPDLLASETTTMLLSGVVESLQSDLSNVSNVRSTAGPYAALDAWRSSGSMRKSRREHCSRVRISYHLIETGQL